MKKSTTSIMILLATVQTFAQNKTSINDTSTPVKPLAIESISAETILPILLIAFLVVMLVALVKYFLEFRLKNKLIDRGMAEQLSTYLLSKNNQEKQHEVVKLAILFCGIGTGLILTYLTSPVDIHSLAIMAFSIGLSYLVYFFYLRKQNQ